MSCRYLGTAPDMNQIRVIDVAGDAQTVYFNDGSDTVVWHQGELSTVVASWHPEATTENVQAFASPNGRYLAYRGPDHNVYRYDAETGETRLCLMPGRWQRGRGRGDGASRRAHRQQPHAPGRDRQRHDVLRHGGAAGLGRPQRLAGRLRLRRRRSCTLISAGDGNFAARFADASDDGSDVFFTTAQPLVSQDDDQALDIYDARIGGGFPPVPPAAARAVCEDRVRGGRDRAGDEPAGRRPAAAVTKARNRRVRLSLGKSASVEVRAHPPRSQRGRGASPVASTVRASQGRHVQSKAEPAPIGR